MNSFRVASVCLVAAAFVFAPLPAQAQIPARVAALENLVDALQSNQAALEARVAKLESSQVDEADLVGSYRVHVFAIDLTGNPAKVQTETSVGTVTLNANGSASLTGMGQHCRLLQGSPWFVECDALETREAVPGTWSIQDGSLVVQVQGENAFGGIIGAGGLVIISGGTADLTGIPNRTPEVYSNLAIAIRLPNP